MRAFLCMCILSITLGGLAACNTDSTLTTNNTQSENDATDDASQKDTVSADDANSSDAEVLPDAQEQADTTSGDDAQTVEDVDTDPDDTTDAGDDNDASENADTTSDNDADDAPPEGSCNDMQDCQSTGGTCIEPGGFAGCGTCRNYLVTCTEDSDCASGSGSSDGRPDGSATGFVCERVAPEDCACDSSISICKSACADSSDCKEGDRCNPDGHCGPTLCSLSEESSRACPPNFLCQDAPCAADGGDACKTCQRAACTDDAECGTSGVCVNGACFGELGSCQLPPP